MKDEDLIQRAIDLVHSRVACAYEPVIIFGSSFNPTTLGHLDIMRAVLTESKFHLQRMYVIPAWQSPLKAPDDYASAADRVRMLHLALETYMTPAERARISVETLEIDREEPSLTAVTLALLILRHQAQQRYTLVCGYDHLQCFTEWDYWAAFKDLCELVFYSREGIALLDTRAMTTLRQLLQAGIRVTIVCRDQAQQVAGQHYCEMQMPEKCAEVSWVCHSDLAIAPSAATTLREYYRHVSRAENIAVPEGILPEVHDYILQQGCYR